MMRIFEFINFSDRWVKLEPFHRGWVLSFCQEHRKEDWQTFAASIDEMTKYLRDNGRMTLQHEIMIDLLISLNDSIRERKV